MGSVWIVNFLRCVDKLQFEALSFNYSLWHILYCFHKESFKNKAIPWVVFFLFFFINETIHICSFCLYIISKISFIRIEHMAVSKVFYLKNNLTDFLYRACQSCFTRVKNHKKRLTIKLIFTNKLITILI